MNNNKLLLESTYYSEYCTEMTHNWIDFIKYANTLHIDDQLNAVNKHVNQLIHYSTDESTWGENDKWTTPLELFSKGKGDCEDIAILKMITLLELDWDPELLRLHYVKAKMGSETVAHMILAVHDQNELDNPLVLDCMISSIRPLLARRDLESVYAFNMNNLWVNNELTEHNPRQRMSKWNTLLNDIEREMY